MGKYFPLFLNAEKKKALIIGSGDLARDKAEKLSSFGIEVIIPEAASLSDEELLNLSPDFVILTDKNSPCKERLFSLCIENRIEINTVDDDKSSTFIFPALYDTDYLTVAVSTGGMSPSAAIKIRNGIKAFVPEKIDDILLYLSDLRGKYNSEKGFSKSFLKKLYSSLCENAFLVGRPLTDEETEVIVSGLSEN